MNQHDFDGRIVNVDKLTYVGKLENVADIDANFRSKRYLFEQADICENARMRDIFDWYEIDTVVHFAAESHMDRSNTEPQEFVQTNVLGTFSLLEASRAKWAGRVGFLFHHVSTDEVYGSLGDEAISTKRHRMLAEASFRPQRPHQTVS